MDSIAQTPPPYHPEEKPASDRWRWLGAGLLILIGYLGGWLVVAGLLSLALAIIAHVVGLLIAAKTCRVPIKKIGLGFRPRLPGCRWRWNNTTWELGLIPGAYLQFAGEGTRDEASTPGSFTSQSWLRRLFIISGGLTANLLVALISFMMLFVAGGNDQVPAIIDEIEAGAPAWQHGLRTGELVRRIEDRVPVAGLECISFERDLVPTVMRSHAGQKLELVVGPPDAAERVWRTLHIEPRLTGDDRGPRLGVLPPQGLDLAPPNLSEMGWQPAATESAAARAEPAFALGDSIIGCTDPDRLPADGATADAAFVTELPVAAYDPTGQKRDASVFRRRLQRLAGQEMIVRVRRADQAVDIKVPAAYCYTFGLRMRIGGIAALRLDGPAARAGLEAGDVIQGVEVMEADGSKNIWASALDPERLPFELDAWAARTPGNKQVSVRVRRGDDARTFVLDWDDSWRFNRESTFNTASPLALSCLGLAYRVRTRVETVAPDSPAAHAGVQPGDVFRSVRAAGARTATLRDEDWAFLLPYCQRLPDKRFVFIVNRGDQELEILMEAKEDQTWPVAERGILFPHLRLHGDVTLQAAAGYSVTRMFDVLGALHQATVLFFARRLNAEALAGPAVVNVPTSYAEKLLAWFIGFYSMLIAVSTALALPNYLAAGLVMRRPASRRLLKWLTVLALALFLVLLGLNRQVVT